MTNYALARIHWNNGRLGLMLVNPGRQRFFIYAEKLLALFDPGGRVEIKLRDRRPDRAVGYYPGQVVGKLNSIDDDAIITLVIGEPYHNLDLPTDDTLPEEFLVKMTFVFLTADLLLLKNSIAMQLEQRNEFDDRMLAAEARPLITPIKPRKAAKR